MSASGSTIPEPSKVGPFWPGFDGLKNMIIFGDSYSSVGYHPRSSYPTPEEPLGVEFPGTPYTEIGEDDRSLPNWVGHLLTSRNGLLIYDYAAGGQTVSGVCTQVERCFLPDIGKKPDWAPWKSFNSLFVTWVGINDCAFSDDPEVSMNVLFRQQQLLYESGARNFMFIDVPPIQHSPAVPAHRQNDAKVVGRYTAWNECLLAHAQQFLSKNPDISVLMFSSYAVFDSVNTDPVKFGFEEADIKKRAGGIWMDHLHPTSRMHEVIATAVEEFLRQFPAMHEQN